MLTYPTAVKSWQLPSRLPARPRAPSCSSATTGSASSPLVSVILSDRPRASSETLPSLCIHFSSSSAVSSSPLFSVSPFRRLFGVQPPRPNSSQTHSTAQPLTTTSLPTTPNPIPSQNRIINLCHRSLLVSPPHHHYRFKSLSVVAHGAQQCPHRCTRIDKKCIVPKSDTYKDTIHALGCRLQFSLCFLFQQPQYEQQGNRHRSRGLGLGLRLTHA